MNKKFNLINCILLIFIIILFIYFLVSLVRTENSNFYSKEIIKTSSASDNLKLAKYEYISENLMKDLNSIKVNDLFLEIFLKLILEEKIKNRENSVIQEIINFYVLGDLDIARDISKEFIETYLNNFDLPEERKWRNYQFILFDDEKEFILYEKISLLKSFNESNTSYVSDLDVKLFEIQKYVFLKDDNSTDIVLVNLSNNENKDLLFNYINFENSSLKTGIIDLKIEFIEENKSYKIKFLIWD